MTNERPRLLFVDDNITDHDPGMFYDEDNPDEELLAADASFAPGTQLGLMGFFVRDLEAEGFEVVPVATVDEALVQLRDPQAKFDVIVLDIMMAYHDAGRYSGDRTAGGLRTGFELAEEARELRPKAMIWLLSQIGPEENKATVDDLIRRKVVIGAEWKLSQSTADATRAFAMKVRESWEAGK